MAQKAEEVKKQIEKDLDDMGKKDPNAPIEDVVPEPEEKTESELWGDFAQEFDSDEDDEVVIPAKDEAELEEAKKDVPPVDTPVEETPAAPAVEEETPAAETPAPAPVETPTPEPAPPQAETPPEAPPAPEKTPQEIETERKVAMEKRQQDRDKALDVLAESYQLSPEEAEKFITSPEEVVPRFAARLFFDVFDAITANVQGVLPQVVMNVQQTQAAQAQVENMFYDANPQLDKAKHKAVVDRYASAYVQVNPNATAEDVIRDVGIQVMYSQGIDPRIGTGQQETPPATPPVQTPPPAHVPAGAGAQHTLPPSPEGANPWGQIADDMAEDYE